MKPEPKDQFLTIRLSEEMARRLHELGQRNERSASAEARLAIRDHLKKVKA